MKEAPPCAEERKSSGPIPMDSLPTDGFGKAWLGVKNWGAASKITRYRLSDFEPPAGGRVTDIFYRTTDE
jgi:hypothetical protein